MAKLTDTDLRALALWDDRPAGTVLTCTQIGESLFPGTRMRQCYARPGGKVAARLARMGFLRRASIEGHAGGYARGRQPSIRGASSTR